jgi:hypothetical protein
MISSKNLTSPHPRGDTIFASYPENITTYHLRAVAARKHNTHYLHPSSCIYESKTQIPYPWTWLKIIADPSLKVFLTGCLCRESVDFHIFCACVLRRIGFSCQWGGENCQVCMEMEWDILENTWRIGW